MTNFFQLKEIPDGRCEVQQWKAEEVEDRCQGQKYFLSVEKRREWPKMKLSNDLSVIATV